MSDYPYIFLDVLTVECVNTLLYLIQFMSGEEICHAILIWEFSVLPPAPTTVHVVADHSGATNEDGWPLVPHGVCNCFATSDGRILLGSKNAVAECDMQSDRSDVDESSSSTDANYYGTEVFCAGCSYAEFQDNVSKVRQYISGNDDCTVDIVREVDNVVDRNALLLVAKCEGCNYKLGYVPLKSIPKVHSALIKNEISSCVVKEVRKVYVRKEGKSVWKCWVWVTKKNKWLCDSGSNVYNSDLRAILKLM